MRLALFEFSATSQKHSIKYDEQPNFVDCFISKQKALIVDWHRQMKKEPILGKKLNYRTNFSEEKFEANYLCVMHSQKEVYFLKIQN